MSDYISLHGNAIPVVYSGNKRIFHGLALAALSVVKRCSRPVVIYILTMGLTDVDKRFTAITDRQAQALDAAIKTVNADSRVIKIDVSEVFRKELIKSKNLKNNYTPYAMLRLLMDSFDLPDRVIYMDIDTMACSDISELYDIDIKNYEFAATLDKVGHIYVRPKYCNSGVLYMNLEKMRETRLLERARQKVIKRKMFMPDQSALNFLAKSKLILPYRFNEQRNIKEDTVIKHFCRYFKWFGPFFKLKNIKQWEREKVHEILQIHDFDDIYELYDGLDKIYDLDGD